jgi:hypothetical protein
MVLLHLLFLHPPTPIFVQKLRCHRDGWNSGPAMELSELWRILQSNLAINHDNFSFFRYLTKELLVSEQDLPQRGVGGGRGRLGLRGLEFWSRLRLGWEVVGARFCG